MSKTSHAKKSSSGALIALFDALTQRSIVVHVVVTILVSILISYVAATYLISGYEDARNTLRNEVSAIIAKNRAAEAVMANEQQYKKDYAQAFRISEDARQMLPNKETISAVMEGVKVLATNSGLSVTRFSSQQAPVASTFASSAPAAVTTTTVAPAVQTQTPPVAGATPPPVAPPAPPAPAAAPQAPPNKLFEVSVKAQVRGSHDAFMKFLAALSTYERIIQIKTFKEESNGKESSIDLELSTFYAPPPEGLTPVPDDVKALAAKLP